MQNDDEKYKKIKEALDELHKQKQNSKENSKDNLNNQLNLQNNINQNSNSDKNSNSNKNNNLSNSINQRDYDKEPLIIKDFTNKCKAMNLIRIIVFLLFKITILRDNISFSFQNYDICFF